MTREEAAKIAEGLPLGDFAPATADWHDAVQEIADAILAAVAAERAARDAKWRPIETAPKDGTKVLLINRARNMAVGLWQQEAWYLIGNAGSPNSFFNNHFGPTHWMSLPPPPDREPGPAR